MSSSTSTFHPFPLLLLELRSSIWAYSMPTTVHIREGADLDVNSTSSPPGQALATKESRAAYLSSGFKPYSIYTTDDWANIHINEDTTIQLVVEPLKNSKNVNVTWTEISVILHDALPVVMRLHVVCSRPERLVRLWCLPEGGLVAPGQSHWFEDWWNKEGGASDREVRQSLHGDLRVTSGVATLEQLEKGSKEVVEERKLVEERVVKGFGLEMEFSTTKDSRLVDEEADKEVEEWQEMLSGVKTPSEADALTEKAIERFIQETGWVPKNSTPSSEYSVSVVYDGECWFTVS
jgi:hypothetical protein